MKHKASSWRMPALAMAAVLAFGGGLAMTRAMPAGGLADGPVAGARLGTPQQCAAYAGLPQGWRQSPTAGMVRVAGGEFVPGTLHGYPDERPAGKVRVRPFWIDQTEVTVAQFAAFVQATGYVTDAERQGAAVVFHVPTDAELRARPYAWWSMVRGADWRHPQGRAAAGAEAGGDGWQARAGQPVALVTQADALAYARWLGRELPTEDEWEFAAKAGRSDAALETAPQTAAGTPTANYWQGVFPVLNTSRDGFAGLAPVGCYPPNGLALFDMIANAWEWTADPYTGPRQSHANGDTAAVAGRQRGARSAVIKGGSFLCAPDFCVRYRASAREPAESDLPTSHIGFRTVLRDG
ncbi:formylglycine-generating enzyme family protein [Cupriavidus nantongensis]